MTDINMKITSKYSRDGKHRFLLSYTWDEAKKRLLVITNFPNLQTNGVVTDLTTTLCVNHAYALDYGGIDLANLFSLAAGPGRLRGAENFQKAYTKTTDQVILLAAGNEAVDKIVFATGSFGTKNKMGQERQAELIEQLNQADLGDKVYFLSDDTGKKKHPISVLQNNQWKMIS